MSVLILRQEAQTTLDKYGLNDYHIRIDSQKYMTITGTCGKALCTIYGIKFGKANPTTKEIPTAVKLLKEFLDLHYPKIKKLLDAKAEYTKHKDFAIKDELKKLGLDQEFGFYNTVEKAILKSPQKISAKFFVETDTSEFIYHSYLTFDNKTSKIKASKFRLIKLSSENNSQDNIASFINPFTPAKHKKLESILTDFANSIIAEAKFQEAQREINNCDV